MVDRSGNNDSDVKFYEYSTLDRFLTAWVEIRINREDLTLFERQTYIEFLASKMAVDVDRLEEHSETS